MPQNNNNENSKLRVIIISEAKEGKRQELLDLVVPLLKLAKKEEGNISYDLYSSTENPNEFLIDEVWSSKEIFNKHYESRII